jgi:hypothetical protein
VGVGFTTKNTKENPKKACTKQDALSGRREDAQGVDPAAGDAHFEVQVGPG